jgi:hypothetical protein
MPATGPAAAPPAVSAPLLPPTDDTALRFVLGFAFLHQQLGGLMGDPLQNERTNPDSCDTQQQTTTGIAYWRCATGILSFVAEPDGLQHWAWVDGRLIDWTGPSADPPAVSEGAPSSVDLGALGSACVEPNDGPDSACLLLDGMSLPGFIREPSGTRAYRVDIADPAEHLLAALTDLPADYDLYLADPSGGVLAQSVQEGTTPEFLDLTIPTGTYYLYVHVDPGRDFDPEDPFWLHLSLGSSTAAREDVGGGTPGSGD